MSTKSIKPSSASASTTSAATATTKTTTTQVKKVPKRINLSATKIKADNTDVDKYLDILSRKETSNISHVSILRILEPSNIYAILQKEEETGVVGQVTVTSRDKLPESSSRTSLVLLYGPVPNAQKINVYSFMALATVKRTASPLSNPSSGSGSGSGFGSGHTQQSGIVYSVENIMVFSPSSNTTPLQSIPESALSLTQEYGPIPTSVDQIAWTLDSLLEDETASAQLQPDKNDAKFDQIVKQRLKNVVYAEIKKRQPRVGGEGKETDDKESEESEEEEEEDEEDENDDDDENNDDDDNEDSDYGPGAESDEGEEGEEGDEGEEVSEEQEVAEDEEGNTHMKLSEEH